MSFQYLYGHIQDVIEINPYFFKVDEYIKVCGIYIKITIIDQIFIKDRYLKNLKDIIEQVVQLYYSVDGNKNNMKIVALIPK